MFFCLYDINMAASVKHKGICSYCRTVYVCLFVWCMHVCDSHLVYICATA
jgi:hypothetical protein